MQEDDITEILEKGLHLGNIFESYEETRFIVQTVDHIEAEDKDDELANADSHAGVICKVDGTWYLMDTSKPAPIKMTRGCKAIKEFLQPLNYMNIFTMQPQGVPHA